MNSKCDHLNCDKLHCNTIYMIFPENNQSDYDKIIPLLIHMDDYFLISLLNERYNTYENDTDFFCMNRTYKGYDIWTDKIKKEDYDKIEVGKTCCCKITSIKNINP